MKQEGLTSAVLIMATLNFGEDRTMAKKCKRNHVACRECGNEHTNPASSSLCEECGPACAMRNRVARVKREQAEREEEYNNLHNW